MWCLLMTLIKIFTLDSLRKQKDHQQLLPLRQSSLVCKARHLNLAADCVFGRRSAQETLWNRACTHDHLTQRSSHIRAQLKAELTLEGVEHFLNSHAALSLFSPAPGAHTMDWCSIYNPQLLFHSAALQHLIPQPVHTCRAAPCQGAALVFIKLHMVVMVSLQGICPRGNLQLLPLQ